MLSCVASILEDLHQSPSPHMSGLLTDNLLSLVESAARDAQPSTSVNETEFSEARRWLENVVQIICGKLPGRFHLYDVAGIIIQRLTSCYSRRGVDHDS